MVWGQKRQIARKISQFLEVFKLSYNANLQFNNLRITTSHKVNVVRNFMSTVLSLMGNFNILVQMSYFGRNTYTQEMGLPFFSKLSELHTKIAITDKSVMKRYFEIMMNIAVLKFYLN